MLNCTIQIPVTKRGNGINDEVMKGLCSGGGCSCKMLQLHWLPFRNRLGRTSRVKVRGVWACVCVCAVRSSPGWLTCLRAASVFAYFISCFLLLRSRDNLSWEAGEPNPFSVSLWPASSRPWAKSSQKSVLQPRQPRGQTTPIQTQSNPVRHFDSPPLSVSVCCLL